MSAALALIAALSLALAITALRREWRAAAESCALRAQLEAVRREQHLAIFDEDYVTARIGDLSEGTLAEVHARDIARWVKGWA